MKKFMKRVIPAVLSMSLAAAPVMAYADEFVAEPGRPYDDETTARLQDNVLEYDEIALLVEAYSPTWKNLKDTYEENKDSLSDIDDLKEQIQEGSDSLQDQASTLSDSADMLKSILGYESPMLPAGMSVAPSAYAEMVYSSLYMEQMSEQMLLSADQLTEITPEMFKVQILDTGRAGLVAGAQSLVIGYEQVLTQKESLAATEELLKAVLQSTERQASAGMATQADVLTARQNLESVQAGMLTIDATEVNLRQNICTMLGWKYDATPEIMPVPEPDLSRIDAMDLAKDTETAKENNFTLRYNRMSKETLTAGSTEMQTLIRTMGAEEAEVASSMVNLYNSVIQAKNSLQTAQASYELAKTQMAAADRKMALGMLGNLEYLQQKNSYKTAEVNVKVAELTLTQAMETYDWAVKGNLALSQ